MGRIRNSLALVKASWTAIHRDKQLLALPVISAAALLLVMALALLPVLAATGFTSDPVALTFLPYGGLFLAYFGLGFVRSSSTRP